LKRQRSNTVKEIIEVNGRVYIKLEELRAWALDVLGDPVQFADLLADCNLDAGELRTRMEFFSTMDLKPEELTPVSQTFLRPVLTLGALLTPVRPYRQPQHFEASNPY